MGVRRSPIMGMGRLPWYAACMSESKPYSATLDELRAIDEGLAGDAIPDAELAAYYRREAARLRAQADTAETVDMRVVLLDSAEKLDKLAECLGTCPKS